MSRVSNRDLEYWANCKNDQVPAALTDVSAELRSARKAIAGINARVISGHIAVSFPDPKALIAHLAQFPEEE